MNFVPESGDNSSEIEWNRGVNDNNNGKSMEINK